MASCRNWIHAGLNPVSLASMRLHMFLNQWTSNPRCKLLLRESTALSNLNHYHSFRLKMYLNVFYSIMKQPMATLNCRIALEPSLLLSPVFNPPPSLHPLTSFAYGLVLRIDSKPARIDRTARLFSFPTSCVQDVNHNPSLDKSVTFIIFSCPILSIVLCPHSLLLSFSHLDI